MKVLFHTPTLNFRGTTVAVADYAKYNQEILGNESIICYNESIPYQRDMGTEPAVLEALSKRFQVVVNTDIEQVIDSNQVDVAYFLRAGNKEPLPTNCKTAVHAVFQLYEPHGDSYAYISEWLANKMHVGSPFVPHIVQLPKPIGDFKQALSIAADKTVIGRIGGANTFDLPFVKQAIVNVLAKRSDYVFVFVGTNVWINHPNVIFLQEIHNLQQKSNFINTCDAMIHGRSQGESFGLAIAEFLLLDKPVMAWEGGADQHHASVLKDSGLLYTEQTVEDTINNIKNYVGREDWSLRVTKFSPTEVMNKFKKVFL